ncbi:MAG: hypothetical protein Ta2E_01950 [Mycoplasmoidaceae bacterium]|nr:MAG: hypothetical protein Ta2E_01950 [Mycoplasmoidaceae bacterium]
MSNEAPIQDSIQASIQAPIQAPIRAPIQYKLQCSVPKVFEVIYNPVNLVVQTDQSKPKISQAVSDVNHDTDINVKPDSKSDIYFILKLNLKIIQTQFLKLVLNMTLNRKNPSKI